MLVNEFLEQSADRFPDKAALICEDERFTFSEIENHANKFSCALIEGGIQRQDRAGVFLEPSVESVVSIFGILKAGLVFFVINPQVKARKLEYILKDNGARVLITDMVHLKEVEAVLPGCRDLKSIIITDYESADNGAVEYDGLDVVSYREILKNCPSKKPEVSCNDIDLASLIYTSGSTGVPKGVMCTHLNMVSAASSIIEYLENRPEDIILNVLPLSFDYGLYQVLMSFKFGGTVVLEKSFIYPYRIIDLMIKEGVTGFPIVPAVAAILFRMRNLEKYDFSSLRYITNTAQALPVKYIKQMQKIFSGVKIYSMYGLTECKRVSYLPPEELGERPASVGKAMPNCEVYIVGDDGEEITAAGEVGELAVRGPNVMKGYWNLPDETARVFRSGAVEGERMLYTGDLFKMDEEGFLYFVARKDDLIKSGGERVSPKEIENVLCEIYGIAEVAVVGMEDEILGQAVKAFVVLIEGADLSEDDIVRYCSRNMENYMVPKCVEIRETLPKTAHGKIDKRKLLEE